MVYVVSRWWYPTHKQEEVNKIFQKSIKEGFPESPGELSVAGAFRGSRKGLIGMAFRKVTQEEIGQAMLSTSTNLMKYNEVEGYEWNVEVWGDITEIPQ